MKANTVYLKIDQNVKVSNKKIILQDVAEIFCADNNMTKQIGNIILYTVKGNKNETLVFSVMKVVSIIQKEHQDITIQTIGEPEFIFFHNTFPLILL